jgi:hypothetical protein
LRDDERGVILLFRNVDIGVERSSLNEAAGVLLSDRAPRRGNGVEAVGRAEPATLGVKGVRFDAFAEALRTGMSGLVVPLFLSREGILALPLFAARGALGGTLIMALLSRDCSGCRNGGLDDRSRVGVTLESWLCGEFSKFVNGLLLREWLKPPKMAALIFGPRETAPDELHARDHHFYIMRT